MTVIELPATPAEVRRDHYGRYKVLPPEGGKLKGYSRATTIAKALDDTSNLMNWGKRMVALGLLKRRDILASIAALDEKDGDYRKKVDAECEKAMEAGGATARRDFGTATHKLVERKVADPNWDVPEPFDKDVDAILATIDAAGFEVVTEYSEVPVVLDKYEIGGTCDLFLRRKSDGKLFAADLKTGAASSVKYAMLAWAIQLAVYAHADNRYQFGEAKDGSEDQRLPMPDLDKDQALILHCEPESGHCDIYSLDIARGWQALEVAMQVREWRKAKQLLVPLVEDDPTPAPEKPAPQPVVETKPEPVAETQPVNAFDSIACSAQELLEQRINWVLERVKVIQDAGHIRTLAANWPKPFNEGDPVPAKPVDVRKGKATWTMDELGPVIDAIIATEKRWEMPFGALDPILDYSQHTLNFHLPSDFDDGVVKPLPVPVDGKKYATQTRVKEIRGRLKKLPGYGHEQWVIYQRILGWSRQAKGTPFEWAMGDDDKKVSERRAAICDTAITLSQHVDFVLDDPDAIVRAILAFSLDTHIQGHPTGHLLGALTIEQAELAANAIDVHDLHFGADGTPHLQAAA